MGAVDGDEASESVAAAPRSKQGHISGMFAISGRVSVALFWTNIVIMHAASDAGPMGRIRGGTYHGRR